MKMFVRVSRRIAAAVCLVCLVASPMAFAQDWPERPVNLIVPYPPGGFADSLSRLLALELGKDLGQPFVIENRPGASGRIGTDAIVRAPNDGYTIGVAVPAMLSLLPVSDPRYAILNSNITPIMLAIRADLALAINPQVVPARNFKDFVAWVKAKNGNVAYASAGIGTGYHLWTEVLAEAAGFQALHAPYKGEAPALNDLLAGHVQFMLVSGAAKPYVDSGKLLVLAQAGNARSSIYPDTPTFRELGLPGVEAGGWLAFVGPKGLPRGVVEKLNGSLVKALKQPAVLKVLSAQGYYVVASKPEELTSVTHAESSRFDKLVKSGRVKLD